MGSEDLPIKRVRVKTREDIERLYPLILDFFAHPEVAARVTEFVFKRRMEGHSQISMCDLPDEWKAREAAREPAADSSLWQAVKRLGLNTEQEREWVKTLTWSGPEAIAERQSALEATDDPWTMHPVLADYDTIFAQYAAAMLLVLCPNIETLSYEDNDYGTPVREILTHNNYGSLPTPCLSKLRVVNLLPTNDIILSDDRFYVDMDVLGLVRLFHRLPSIESISADAVSPNGDVGYSDSIPPASSVVKRIQMTHVNFTSKITAALIRMPKGLEQFTCTSGGRKKSDGCPDSIVPATVGRALWCQRRSLKQLDLDLDQHVSRNISEESEESEDSEDGEEIELGDELEREIRASEAAEDVIKTSDLDTGRTYDLTIGSLHDFDQLTHLRIGVRLLLGPEGVKQGAPFRLVDALPHALERLSILGYTRKQDAKHDEQLDELLALKAERLPNLQTLEGVDEYLPRGEDVDDVDAEDAPLWEPEAVDDSW